MSSQVLSRARYFKLREMVLRGEIRLVECGERLFSYGYWLEQLGWPARAEEIYEDAISLIESLSDKAASSSDLLDLGILALRHGEQLEQLGRQSAARSAYARAVEFFDSWLPCGISAPGIELLAKAVLNRGRMQCLDGDDDLAHQSFARARALCRTLFLLSSPGDKVRHQATGLLRQIDAFSPSAALH